MQGPKIFAAEIKAETRDGAAVELGMAACQVQIPPGQYLRFTVTLHTTIGDINIGQNEYQARNIYPLTNPVHIGAAQDRS